MERSPAQGIVALFAGIGQLIGAVLVGAVAASAPASNPASGYINTFLVVVAVNVVLVLPSWLLKNRAAELDTVKANETE
jgi:Na+/melibiose symporter-like transporter